MTAGFDMSLFLITFRAEADEHMVTFEDAILKLEKDFADDDSVNAAFRSIHTIKGAGGLFDFPEMVRFAHNFESYMDNLRGKKVPVTVQAVSLCFTAFDHFRNILNFYLNENQSISMADLMKRSDAVNELFVASAGARKKIQIADESKNFQESAELTNADAREKIILCKRSFFKEGLSLENALRYLRKHIQLKTVRLDPQYLPTWSAFNPEENYLRFQLSFANGETEKNIEFQFNEAFELLMSEIEIVQVEKIETQSAAEDISTKKDDLKDKARLEVATKKETASAEFIRVDSRKLDDLVNLVGTLVVKNSNVRLRAQESVDPLMLRPVTEMSRLIEQLREIVLKMRMVAIGESFRKMERLVRDASLKIGKKVNLDITGEATELDKNIIEKLNDPLMHIIRNAIDHGLEFPNERIKQCKNETGHIKLDARHEAGSVIIEISDDGQGIDTERVLQKAIEKGLADKDREYSLTEIQNFVFHPGFSTAHAVTELSGRGVGMDVVKKNIEGLRGDIRISSTRHRGTMIHIRLPLTLAIIDGFLVRTGEQKFVIPLGAIQTCLDFKRGENVTAHTHNLFDLRGDTLPFVRLADFFAMETGESKGASDYQSIVVVQHGDARFGIVIDEQLGEFQTVIKPLNGFLSGIPGVGGATILGNGDFAYILDIQGLFEKMNDYKESRKIA